MSSTTYTGLSPDRIDQLQRRVLEHRPLHPHYNNALILCVSIGALASIIRGQYDWTYEEAGILLNLAFWGGYGIVFFYLGPMSLLGMVRDWRYSSAMRELKMANALPDGVEMGI